MIPITDQNHVTIIEGEATTLVVILTVVMVQDIIDLGFNEVATTATVATTTTAAAAIHLITMLQHLNNIETYLPYFVTSEVKDIML